VCGRVTNSSKIYGIGLRINHHNLTTSKRKERKMSFTRSMKYGNAIVKRKLKQKVTSERLETAGFFFVVATTIFVMNLALLNM
jgi:hypothetical protein